MADVPDPAKADPMMDGLGLVHRRLGGLGIDIQTFGGAGANPRIEVRWRRSYDGVLSDERFASACTLEEAIGRVLDYEEYADASD